MKADEAFAPQLGPTDPVFRPRTAFLVLTARHSNAKTAGFNDRCSDQGVHYWDESAQFGLGSRSVVTARQARLESRKITFSRLECSPSAARIRACADTEER